MDTGKQFGVIKLSASAKIAALPEMGVNRSGWINYGDKNDYPQRIIELNSKSPVNSAIIESTVTYIVGKGVRNSRPTADTYVGKPNPLESWDDVVEKVSFDYKQFGGFYLQIIVNKGSTTVSVYHQDFSAVRIGQTTDTGVPETFRISNNWKKTSGKNKPLEVSVWPGIHKAKKGQPYIFHYFDYVPSMQAYTVPKYHSALSYIEADGALGPYYNNSIKNGFTPSVVITMPSNPDTETKAEFQKEMEDAFTGEESTSKIVVVWGESGDVKPEIVPFQAAANADIYNNVEGIIFQKIISANRLSSPTLAGVSGSGNLSGNAAEIVDAYVLYNYTVVEKMRNKILEKLNVFTSINGTASLTIEELDVLPKIRETTDGITAVTEEEGIDALATKIGVGGTQALTAIVENPNMDIAAKKGLLKTLFGLSDEEISSLFGETALAALKRKPTLLTALKKFIARWR